jgi:hypothetical protein
MVHCGPLSAARPSGVPGCLAGLAQMHPGEAEHMGVGMEDDKATDSADGADRRRACSRDLACGHAGLGGGERA